MDSASLRRDTLFLVHQFLKDTWSESGNFADTLAAFERELESSNIFGETLLWNGISKPLSLENMRKKNSRLPSKLLLTHLGGVVNNEGTGSLLQITDYSKDDELTLKQYRQISKRLVDCLFQISSKRIELKRIQSKVAELDNGLMEISEMDSMKQIGLARERKDVLRKCEALEVMLVSLESELAEGVADLRLLGRLGGDVYRGICSSRSSWLQNRSLGAVSARWPQHLSGLGRVLAPSAKRVFSRMMTSFSFLWHTSGHYLAPAYCIVFDLTGRYAITGADDALVKVWDVERGQLVMTLRGHKGFITLIAISPDNSIIASSDTVGDIRLWRMKNGECVSILRHNGSVNWMKFDEMTCALATGGEDGFAYVWDLSVLLPLEDNSFPLIELLLEEIDSETSKNFTSKNASSISGSPEPSSASRVRPGLFSWSSTSSLCLAHRQLTDSGELPPVNVLCVDVCPTGQYVATGREDGVINIWTFYRGENPSEEAALDASDPINTLNRLRAAMSPREWVIMDSIANHLLVRLIGHVAPVTDIKFNSKGDRLVTGSMKEGTVRIWSFNKNFAKYDNIVLSMSEDNSIQNQPSNSMRRQRYARMKNQLFNVCWSFDDLYVLTLQSAEVISDFNSSQLKIWDPLTGSLLKRIVVSENEANVLAPHPSISSVVVTGGTDGIVNVWDINSESKCLEYAIKCPHNIHNIDYNTPIKILDASFSTDGLHLAVVDHIGRLFLFGLEDPERYRGVEAEQYFSSDYNEVYTDANDITIDVGTSMPVHLLSTSYICRMDGSAYTTQAIVKMCDVTLLHNELKFWLKEKRLFAEKCILNLESSFRLFKRNKMRSINNFRESDISRMLITQASKRDSSKIISAPRVAPCDYIDTFYAAAVNQTEDSDDDPDWLSVESSDDENLFRKRHSTISTRRTQRLEVEDNDERPPLSRRQQRIDRRSRRRSNRTMNEHHLCLSDSTDDNSIQSGLIELERPKKSQNLGLQRHRAARESKSKIKKFNGRKRQVTEEIESVSYIPPSEFRRWNQDGRSYQSVPFYVPIYREWVIEDKSSDFLYCPQLGDSVVYFPQGHAEYLRNFHETSDQQPWLNFPVKWAAVECRVSSIEYELPRSSEHKKSISIIAKIGLTLTGIPIHVAGTSGNNFTLTEFHDPSTRRSSLDKAGFSNFTVSIRKLSGTPDFIIPSYIYRRAMCIRWRQGMRFQTPFLELDSDSGSAVLEIYYGEVLDIRNFDESYPGSPWECLKVKWESDNGVDTVDTLGPWDAFLIEDAGGSFSSSSLALSLKHPKFEATALTIEEKGVLETAVISCLDDDKYEPFAYPIDPSVFQDYLCIVAAPMHLDLVKSRLQNNYYRQIEAFEYDIHLIVKNCELYNLKDADIIVLAEELRNKVLFLSGISTNNCASILDSRVEEEFDEITTVHDKIRDDSPHSLATDKSSKISLRIHRNMDDEITADLQDEQLCDSSLILRVNLSNKAKTDKENSVDSHISEDTNEMNEIISATTVYREWASEDAPSDFAFCPQVGDSVVYFPQGHAEYLLEFPESSRRPWDAFPARWAAVECRVLNVDYELPSYSEFEKCRSVIAIIGLALTGIPIHASGTYGVNHSLTEFKSPSTRRSSVDTSEFSYFTVSMRKLTKAPDFIVPSYLYYRAACIKWLPGMRFQAPFLNIGEDGSVLVEMEIGMIIEISDSDVKYPGSPWECLKVSWGSGDSGVADRLGPWDVFLIDDESVQFAIVQPLNGSMKCQARILSDETKHLIDNAVSHCIEDERYEPFAFEIDTVMFPDYLSIVPVPVNLFLIKSRVQNNFYRQIEAFEFDVNLLLKNCEQYNDEGADIVKLGRELRSHLLSSTGIVAEVTSSPFLEASGPEIGGGYCCTENSQRRRFTKIGRKNRRKLSELSENAEASDSDFSSSDVDSLVVRVKRPRVVKKPKCTPSQSSGRSKQRRGNFLTRSGKVREKDFEDVSNQEHIYRAWATEVAPTDFAYCPQIGDSVVYFPQGHAEYLLEFPELSSRPWDAFPARWAAVECRILSIEYKLPTESEFKKCRSVIAIIGLALTGIPVHVKGTHGVNHTLTEFKSPSTRRSSLDNSEYSYFTVSMRKLTDTPDFIVPSYLYYRAACMKWLPGMHFRTPFLITEIDGSVVIRFESGVIDEISDRDPKYAGSPWECLKVHWDSGDEDFDRLGPWDAFLIDESSAPLDLIHSLRKSKHHASVLTDETKKLTDIAVSKCLREKTYEPFAFDIEKVEYPDCLTAIAVPINLSMMKSRIHNNYYRQIESFEYDIHLLVNNCQRFNHEGAEILSLVEKLRCDLFALIGRSPDNESHGRVHMK